MYRTFGVRAVSQWTGQTSGPGPCPCPCPGPGPVFPKRNRKKISIPELPPCAPHPPFFGANPFATDPMASPDTQVHATGPAGNNAQTSSNTTSYNGAVSRYIYGPKTYLVTAALCLLVQDDLSGRRPSACVCDHLEQENSLLSDEKCLYDEIQGQDIAVTSGFEAKHVAPPRAAPTHQHTPHRAP